MYKYKKEIVKTNVFYKMVKYISPFKGKKVCILAGIHGNEIPGILAVENILKQNDFFVKNGEVCFIIVNKKAINANKRYIEEDLNRCFFENQKSDSYESLIARELKKILNNYDICLDLHSTREESIPFIVCEKNAYQLIKNFPIKIVCSGFDEHQPGATDTYMNQNGKIGICVESGYMKDKNSVFLVRDIIFTFLNNVNMIDYISQNKEKVFYKVTKMYRNKSDFTLTRKFENFEWLTEGEIIGYDGKQEIFTKKKCFIVFAQNRMEEDTENEAFLLGVETIKNEA